jgi:adenylate cyclase
MYVLTYQESGESKRFMLTPGETIAGRAATCDLVLDDVSVSRRHARFSVSDAGCVVTDLGGRNGTFRNGEPISTALLDDGDRILLGKFPVTLESSADDRLELTEHHTLIEAPGTIYRPIVELGTIARVEAGGDDGVRFLRLMADVARTLIGNRPVGEVLAHVVQLAFDTCPAERAFVILRDDATGTLVPRVASTRSGGDIRSATISRTIVNRVMTDRVSLLASDAQVDDRIGPSESVVAQQVRAFMCAPLWHDRDVIGVLYVDASLSQRFSATDLDLLTSLSNFAAVAIEQARLAGRIQEETRFREKLQRYHSPAVVSRIFESGGDVDAPFLAQEREISVLFADIVGFTSRSEGMTPAQTTQMLNGFFGRMTDVVFEHEGTLDKYIGDALMAVFGAPLDQPDHATRAVQTARQMLAALAKFNAESGASPLQVRMGIHSGLAMAGDIGSLRRREYTVLGDTVNIASRLESSIAKPGQVVISGVTRARLPDSIPVRSLGEVAIRGRHEPVEVWEVQPITG